MQVGTESPTCNRSLRTGKVEPIQALWLLFLHILLAPALTRTAPTEQMISAQSMARPARTRKQRSAENHPGFQGPKIPPLQTAFAQANIKIGRPVPEMAIALCL